jgi:hypothetical protein
MNAKEDAMPGRNMKKARKVLLRALGQPGALGPTEEDLERGRRLDAILGGLTDAQREIVLGDLNDPEVRRPGGRDVGKLTRQILALVIGTERPAVMHPEVARVYAEHPDASPLHDCEDCGLGIPCRGGSKDAPFYRWFDACPNCGGRVGYCAYFHKHGASEQVAAW